jgi:sugar phosphate isomerase/epimerase
MTIGVRAHDFGSGDFATFENIIKEIASAGYQTLQLAPAKSIDQIGGMDNLTKEHLIRIKEILAKYNLSVGVLGCYLDFTNDCPKVRRHNINLFKKYIPFAKFLDAKMIATETSYSHITEANRNTAMKYVIEAFKEIMPVAEDIGVLVAIEAVVTHALNTPELTKELLGTINSPYLKVLYDQANLLTPDLAPSDKILLERAKNSLGNQVVAVHLKNFIVDNNNKVNSPLDSGVVDIPAIIQWVTSQNPNIVIIREESARESFKEDLAYIQKYLQV